MGPVRALALLLAFVLEVGALAVVAVALWTSPAGVIAAVAAVAAMGFTWGVFAAPKASRPLHGPPRVGFLVLWFGVAVLALGFVAGVLWALVAAVVLVGNHFLLRATDGRPTVKPELG